MEENNPIDSIITVILRKKLRDSIILKIPSLVPIENFTLYWMQEAYWKKLLHKLDSQEYLLGMNPLSNRY